MSKAIDERHHSDSAPGEVERHGHGIGRDVLSYCVGLFLAIALTGAAFWAVHTHLIYGPGIPFALFALAIAQMGIHLVFFLHITTDPDNTNNVLALAFGILIACLIIFGSMWIMGHLNHTMMPMEARVLSRPHVRQRYDEGGADFVCKKDLANA